MAALYTLQGHKYLIVKFCTTTAVQDYMRQRTRILCNWLRCNLCKTYVRIFVSYFIENYFLCLGCCIKNEVLSFEDWCNSHDEDFQLSL